VILWKGTHQLAVIDREPTTESPEPRGRLARLDVARLEPPPRLIVNPHAGHKLGMPTNASTLERVETALTEAGLRFDLQLTESPRHATRLARDAVRDGCKLVIAAGGDGTVAETGEALVHTDTALGIMPLGSIMNMARALCIPRDLRNAAMAIAEGQTLAMDVGRVENHYFLEAGGVGLAAGLFGYFNRLDSGTRHPQGVLLAMLRFVRHLRHPRLVIVADGRHFHVRAPQVTVSNGPYVGAAYVLAPEAKLDDGLLDVVIFRGMSVFRVLVHMALVAGGRRLPPPPGVQLVRARSVDIAVRRRRRPLPVHADGDVVGATPAHFEVLPAALRVVVGRAQGMCAWSPPPSVSY
jgi:diacylglycerol kinase (ATP)